MKAITIVLTRDQAHTAVEALRRLASSKLAADASKTATAAAAARTIAAAVGEHDRSANDDPRSTRQ